MRSKNKLRSEGGLLNLMRYMKKYTTALVFALIFAIGGSIITVISPNKLSEVTDIITNGIMTGININRINEIGMFLVILYAISITLSYLQGFIMATVTQKTTKKLRSDISDKINRLPLKYYDKTTVGEVLSRVTNDVDTIGQTLNQSMGTLVSGISLLIGSLYMMFVTDVTLTITAILSTAFGFALMMMIISKSQKHFENQQRLIGEVNGHVEEAYTGHSVIKVYNAQEKTNKEFKDLNNKLRESGWKAQFISGLMMPLMTFIGNLKINSVLLVR